MKTTRHLRALTLGLLTLAAAIVLPGQAHAVFTLTLQETGGNVSLTGAGTLNTLALTAAGSGTATASIYPAGAGLTTGPATNTPFTRYNGGGLTGPTSFGGGIETNASSGSGNPVGVYGGGADIFVPQGYASGAPLTGSATFTGATFASLGFNPGTYTFTWGTGANTDSLIVTSVVPEPSTWAFVLAGAGLLGVGVLRRRSVRA